MELHIGYLELGDQSDGANPRQGDQLGDCCVYMVSDDRGPDGGLGREAVAIGSSAQAPPVLTISMSLDLGHQL